MRIVFLVADSLRADYLGCYNPERSTPLLDSLAAEGVTFDTAITSAPWTVPSLGAMLTGVWSHRLGLVKWDQPWNRRFPTIFDYVREQGGRVASFVFDPSRLFLNCPEASVVCSSQDTDGMLAWFREHNRGSYFAFVHYWWTHIPYLERELPHPSWKALCDEMLGQLGGDELILTEGNRERLRALYALAVETFSETWLPRILEAARPDFLVITADHGESWGERMPRGEKPTSIFDLHGNHLHDEVVRIPWIIHGPAVVPSVRVKGLVRSVDMLPTVLDLAGVRYGSCTGSSLVRAIERGTVPQRRLAFFSRNRDLLDARSLTERPEDVYLEFGCRSEEVKVLKRTDTGAVYGYDLRSDPAEAWPITITPDRLMLPDDTQRGLDTSFFELVAALEHEIDRAVVGAYDEQGFREVRRQLENLGYL